MSRLRTWAVLGKYRDVAVNWTVTAFFLVHHSKSSFYLVMYDLHMKAALPNKLSREDFCGSTTVSVSYL
jgi:hypothetical protein